MSELKSYNLFYSINIKVELDITYNNSCELLSNRSHYIFIK